jgi:hypothetical protein
MLLFFTGVVGITLNVDWFEPLDSSDLSHVEACNTKLQFFAGWFANPIYIDGKYPEIMRQKVPIHNWLKIFLKEYIFLLSLCICIFKRQYFYFHTIEARIFHKYILRIQNFDPLCNSMSIQK